MKNPEDREALRDMPRMFVFEPGWQVGRKTGSDREFCYQMAPGQDYYHRLMDGELHLVRADEKVCIPCAARRGLLSGEPKVLRDPIAGVNVAIEDFREGFEVIIRDDPTPPRGG